MNPEIYLCTKFWRKKIGWVSLKTYFGVKIVSLKMNFWNQKCIFRFSYGTFSPIRVRLVIPLSNWVIKPNLSYRIKFPNGSESDILIRLWELLFPSVEVLLHHYEKSQLSLASEDASPSTHFFKHLSAQVVEAPMLSKINLEMHMQLIWRCTTWEGRGQHNEDTSRW